MFRAYSRFAQKHSSGEHPEYSSLSHSFFCRLFNDEWEIEPLTKWKDCLTSTEVRNSSQHGLLRSRIINFIFSYKYTLIRQYKNVTMYLLLNAINSG